jgi:hypothetical protein
MSLDKNIQEWVTLDNEHKALNNRLKLVRERKHLLEERLFEHEQFASLTNSLSSSPLSSSPLSSSPLSKDISIHISDGILKFTNTKITAPLTFTYIKQTLGEIIKNKEQIETILSYLKSKRETKIVPEIKRYIQIKKT